MSPQFFCYPGVGVTNAELYSYSQSVKVGPLIKCSGQGGWDDKGELMDDLTTQIETAFKNVQKALKDAGGKGWSQVYSVRSYHIDLEGSFDLMVELFKKFMPDHKPIWVCIGVTKLGIPGMQVEIEVEAYDA